MPTSTGELLKYRDELITKLNPLSKQERARLQSELRLVNKLIALRAGDNEAVNLVEVVGLIPCDVPDCDRAFTNSHGLAMHKRKGHGIPGTSRARGGNRRAS